MSTVMCVTVMEDETLIGTENTFPSSDRKQLATMRVGLIAVWVLALLVFSDQAQGYLSSRPHVLKRTRTASWSHHEPMPMRKREM